MVCAYRMWYVSGPSYKWTPQKVRMLIYDSARKVLLLKIHPGTQR